MANTFDTFPAILSDQTTPQTYTLEDGTAYIVSNIGTVMTPLYVWRLRALELPLEVLSRADVILSPLVTPRPAVMNNLDNVDYLVYNVSMLTPSRASEMVTRTFLSNGEQFFLGLDLSTAAYLTHMY